MFVVLHWLALGLYQFYELPLRTRIRRWLAPPADAAFADSAPVLLPITSPKVPRLRRAA